MVRDLTFDTVQSNSACSTFDRLYITWHVEEGGRIGLSSVERRNPIDTRILAWSLGALVRDVGNTFIHFSICLSLHVISSGETNSSC